MSLFGHDNVIDYCNLEQTTLNLYVFHIGNEMIDIILACVQTSPISFVARGKGTSA